MERYLKPEQEELLLVLVAVDRFKTPQPYFNLWKKYLELDLEESYLAVDELSNLKVLKNHGLIELTTAGSAEDEDIVSIKMLPSGNQYFKELFGQQKYTIKGQTERGLFPLDEERVKTILHGMGLIADGITISTAFLPLINATLQSII